MRLKRARSSAAPAVRRPRECPERRSATKRISLPMMPATRQCATCTGVVVSRVAATATASVIFTSVRCCVCTAAQLAAAVRWACAVLAMVASSAAEWASLWIMVEATVRRWERVACARAGGRSQTHPSSGPPIRPSLWASAAANSERRQSGRAAAQLISPAAQAD